MTRRAGRAGSTGRAGAGAALGAAGFGVALLLAVSGCTGSDSETRGPVAATAAPSTTAPPATESAPTTAAPAPADKAPGAAPLTGAFHPTGDPATVADELDAPWSIVTLADGTVLVDERNTGAIKEIRADGSAGAIGTVPGVAAAGEGGLLGLAAYVDNTGVVGAASGGTAPTYLYAYLTTASDNRVVRMELAGGPGAFTLGQAYDVLTGIPKASNHNGGRILFGPDGMLYITAGDANQSSNAQRVESLSGKILRVTPTGAVPGDNPFPGSPVYSIGHRNPQGMAWSADGTMYAAEFGQNTWDELNVITPGANYGWPTVEGLGDGEAGATANGVTNPIVQWSTDEASPSGLAMVGDTLFMAALGGERIWSITVAGDGASQTAPAVKDFLVDSLGRIRDVSATADGSGLLLLSNNTDGRGSARAGDDRLARVALGAGAS
ncbi:PQQ-dependent sugar dehydrogenase [Subtercola boreus]|uniref:Glucose/Sorbosone dehydrogenase domain-containing protein n=1 Tax=Subtercola boreus TaxID=120213 RepID=A0A3E0WAB0_9MICO|nr:PQQ-dependent sugar dehydrogenase [Subtercola boreus]RFA19474.1 hypothetical protein B7R24_12615 [Subtercola boreus]RFA19735.1 hypothetical protein B7R23_12595 [Subtercola boreus]RFA26101.1 hypothetical protein B7R25_12715 [Subtercola boreus]